MEGIEYDTLSERGKRRAGPRPSGADARRDRRPGPHRERQREAPLPSEAEHRMPGDVVERRRREEERVAGAEDARVPGADEPREEARVLVEDRRNELRPLVLEVGHQRARVAREPTERLARAALERVLGE